MSIKPNKVTSIESKTRRLPPPNATPDSDSRHSTVDTRFRCSRYSSSVPRLATNTASSRSRTELNTRPLGKPTARPDAEPRKTNDRQQHRRRRRRRSLRHCNRHCCGSCALPPKESSISHLCSPERSCCRVCCVPQLVEANL